MNNSKNLTMSFNVSEIRQSVGDHSLLTSAELRMQIKQTTIFNEQRVELYYGLGSSARYLATRFIDNDMKDKWLSFDVMEPLQNWLKGSGKITKTFLQYKTCIIANVSFCKMSSQMMSKASNFVCSVNAARPPTVASASPSLDSQVLGGT